MIWCERLPRSALLSLHAFLLLASLTGAVVPAASQTGKAEPAASAEPSPAEPAADEPEGDDDRTPATAATKLALAQPPYPRAVQQALDSGRKECLGQGGARLTYKRGIVRKIDLTGDGRDDYLVDFRAGFCAERLYMFNGTGGWDLDIFVARPKGGLTHVFSGRVRDYDISPGPGPRTITFQLHGGYCGLAGAEQCVKHRKMSERAFAFRDR